MSISKSAQNAVVTSVCPLVHPCHASFLTFFATGTEVDYHRSIVDSEHDVRRIDIVMDDGETVEVLNVFLMKTILCIERSSDMIDALDRVLTVPGEAETRNTAFSNDAAVMGSDVPVWMVDENLTDSSSSKHKFAQTSWIP